MKTKTRVWCAVLLSYLQNSHLVIICYGKDFLEVAERCVSSINHLKPGEPSLSRCAGTVTVTLCRNRHCYAVQRPHHRPAPSRCCQGDSVAYVPDCMSICRDGGLASITPMSLVPMPRPSYTGQGR
ncbi:hypothetical protein E2C01_084973 [Portunus trituberculatus]|uniref:Uncharacterized protein n=1 Tax=Portunus trituberculatus TaxID=210409 RepID=A0A5B7J975_PORTR|nr:hypothetical protein [Portunus trituberculatus]